MSVTISNRIAGCLQLKLGGVTVNNGSRARRHRRRSVDLRAGEANANGAGYDSFNFSVIKVTSLEAVR